MNDVAQIEEKTKKKSMSFAALRRNRGQKLLSEKFPEEDTHTFMYTETAFSLSHFWPMKWGREREL